MKKRARRKPVRHPEHDYTGRGVYHVILCTKRRAPLMGRIEEDRYVQTPLGQFVQQQWMELSDHFPMVRTGACVAMPDHFHGLLSIDPQEDSPLHLDDIVRRFKRYTSRQGRTLMASTHTLWQSHYWDVIVRNQLQLERTHRYILDNPARLLLKHTQRDRRHV